MSASTFRTLLQFELQGIQRYISKGSRLRDMRGASALLDHLNRVRIPEILAHHAGTHATLLRASGSVTVVGIYVKAPEGLEATLLDQFAACYRQEAPGTRTHGCAVPTSEAFATDLGQLAFQMALEEGAHPTYDPDTALLSPLVRFCAVCGQRPVTRTREAGTGYEGVCTACHTCGTYGQTIRKKGPLARFLAYARAHGASWASDDPERLLPDDFATLAGERDLALILADGNALGQTIRAIPSATAYQTFSTDIATAVETAVFEALLPHGPRGSAQQLPWEILYIGGDDVLLATAADLAFDVTTRLMHEVEQRTASGYTALNTVVSQSATPAVDAKPLMPACLTMAAGVAIASPSYPFLALRSLAKDLETSAKQRAYATPGTSTLDFHRLTATGRITLKDVRTNELQPQRQPADAGVVLTKRPFTLADFEAVAAVAQTWKNATGRAQLPRNKLALLREALFTSPAEAMHAWTFVRGRARSADEFATWNALTTLLPADHGAVQPWTYSPTEACYRTPLLDVLDLYTLL